MIMLAMTTLTTNAQGVYNKAAKQNSLPLVNEWDKTFPKSDKVRHEKVTFSNRFGITLATFPKNIFSGRTQYAFCPYKAW